MNLKNNHHPRPRHLLDRRYPARRETAALDMAGLHLCWQGRQAGILTKGNRMKDIIIDRIVFSQEPDTNADQDDCQRIDVEFLDNGGGHFYYRISTDDWAIDESSRVLDFCKKIVAHNERTVGETA